MNTQEYIEKLTDLQHYIKKSTPLRISLPYCGPVEQERIFSNEDKNKWMDKKGFQVSIGSNNDFISNYVNQTPGLLPNEFKFREIEKSKWIDKNGFKFKRGNDYLLKCDLE